MKTNIQKMHPSKICIPLSYSFIPPPLNKIPVKNPKKIDIPISKISFMFYPPLLKFHDHNFITTKHCNKSKFLHYFRIVMLFIKPGRPIDTDSFILLIQLYKITYILCFSFLEILPHIPFVF